MSEIAVRQPPAVPVGRLPVLLALFGAIGPISTDMYLPAFPAMRAELHGDDSAAPLTLAAWFLGIAFGQLLLGPLSDRTGRRAPLMIGTGLYIASCVGCALCGSMTELILWRLLAAFGGAASLVVPRAIIGDVARSEQEAAHYVSRVQVIMSVAPMLTPTLGGLLVEAGSWRWIFWASAGFGLVCLLFIQLSLPETHPPATRSPLPTRALAAGYRRIATDRAFLTHALTGSFATFGLFAFLGGAPVVFLRHFGMSPTVFGLTFIANGAAYALGTRLNVALVNRFGRHRILTAVIALLAATSAAMVVCAGSGLGRVWGIEIPFVVVMLLLGCVLPDCGIGAIAPHVQDAGIASALYGTSVFAIGAIGTIAVGFVGGPNPVPLACLLLFGAVLAILTAAVRPLPAAAAPPGSRR